LNDFGIGKKLHFQRRVFMFFHEFVPQIWTNAYPKVGIILAIAMVVLGWTQVKVRRGKLADRTFTRREAQVFFMLISIALVALFRAESGKGLEQWWQNFYDGYGPDLARFNTTVDLLLAVPLVAYVLYWMCNLGVLIRFLAYRAEYSNTRRATRTHR
jgi:hypothetical protein